MAFALPIHNLPMDKPAASEVFEKEKKKKKKKKKKEEEEEKKNACKSSSANMTFPSTASELKFRGNNFLQDRSECGKCGKYSGMDDFVHNALYAGIHSVEFMKDFLLGKTEQATPYTEHAVVCSRCDTKHDENKSWKAWPPWRN
ncbi:hypothetical protein MY4038_007087 [Beauveria bassiana]